MIKETLKVLFIDNCTLQEAADKLGVTQNDIRDRLIMLQHMGYVREICNNSSPKSSACCSCTAASSCSGNTGISSSKAYQLTEKGERICRN
ncbi:hypothetical protein [Methanolobus vulcani]|uniref:FeoC like transcriptional regulator n=1 Tax=Methanolobus vulcani TaxID=38026 RepID=A0A7Z8KNI1_9EURY|nr:hypothetical protein [Methanolobus vulcani]TQD25416.1 hypothetical protein FKV42_10330 [Methanolobus vulcani]